MGRSKIGLKFEGWQELLANLEKVGGGSAIRDATEKALEASKEHVVPKLEQSTEKSALPRKGKYSTGGIKEAINKDATTQWEGLTVNTNVGFDFAKGGMKQIFLMYGTPRMKPAKGMKSAIYGSKTQKEIAEIQEEIITKEIKKIMEG